MMYSLPTQVLSYVARPVVRRQMQQTRLVCSASEAGKMCRDLVSAPKTDAFESRGETFKVTFLTAEQSVTIDCPDDMYILDAAEAAGLDLPCTCRGGICGACVARVSVGEVDQTDVDDLSFTLDEEQIEQGMALICMARAKGDCTLETQCDWGVRLGFAEWKGATGRLSGTPRSMSEVQ